MEIVFLIVLCFFAILVVFFFWLWVGERTRVYELEKTNKLLGSTLSNVREVVRVASGKLLNDCGVYPHGDPQRGTENGGRV